MRDFSKLVHDQFFQTFYHERIEIVRSVGRQYKNQLDISLLLFWFSVIDFYGGLYRIGKNNKIQTYRNGKLKLSDKVSFELFIRDFFSKPENELGNLLYSVFRSGLVHQMSPKKGILIWDEDNLDLVRVDVDSQNADDLTNKVITINIHQLEQLAYNAYREFRRQVEERENTVVCENICNHLIGQLDIIGDGTVLNEEYSALPQQIKDNITRYV